MSLSAGRQEIADILSSVDNVQGYKYRPTIISDGDGFALLERLDSPAGENFQANWKVVIALPPGEQDAMEWFEDNYEAIADAFADAGYSIDQIEPGALATEVGDKDAMILTLRKEA